MTDEWNPERALSVIENSWANFLDAFTGLSDIQLVAPGAVGEWSAANLASHIAMWDEITLEDANTRASDPAAKPQHDWQRLNDEGYERDKARTPAEAFAEMHQQHAALIETYKRLPVEAYSVDIADLIGHYDEHGVEIRGWRSAQAI